MNAGQFSVAIVVSKSSISARDVFRPAGASDILSHISHGIITVRELDEHLSHSVGKHHSVHRPCSVLMPFASDVFLRCHLSRYAGLYVSINSILLYFLQTVI